MPCSIVLFLQNRGPCLSKQLSKVSAQVKQAQALFIQKSLELYLQGFMKYIVQQYLISETACVFITVEEGRMFEIQGRDN